MAVVLITDTQNYIGTAAERAGMTTTSVKAGATFFEHDTQLAYIWTGSAWAVFPSGSGAATAPFSTLTPDDTTPSVAGITHALTANTVATTITNFDDPAAGGQELIIVFGDANTTIADNANINLQGGLLQGPMALLDTFHLVYDGTQWVEIIHSLNS